MDAENILPATRSAEAGARAQPLGSTMTDGRSNTAVSLEEVLDTIRNVPSSLLWQTKPGDPQAKEVVLALEILLVPASYEAAAMWIARFLQHFPSRNDERDGVIISDLAADFVSYEVSLGAVINTLDEARRSATMERPFMPPTGVLLKESIDRTRNYARLLTRLTVKSTQTTKPPGDAGAEYALLTPQQRAELDSYIADALKNLRSGAHDA